MISMKNALVGEYMARVRSVELTNCGFLLPHYLNIGQSRYTF